MGEFGCLSVRVSLYESHKGPAGPNLNLNLLQFKCEIKAANQNQNLKSFLVIFFLKFHIYSISHYEVTQNKL